MTPADFLRKLVSIYSPSGREEEVARFIVHTGKKLGYTTALIDKFNNAILEIGPATATKTIVLLGHIDTVKGFLPVRMRDGVLTGRGTVDAKGPFAAFFFAALAAAPKLKNVKIMVAGASSEETHGTGARALADKIATPNAVIVGEPSDWAGITLGYKGILIMEYYQKCPLKHSANESSDNVIESSIEFTEKIKDFVDAYNVGKTPWTSLQRRVERFEYYEDDNWERVVIRMKFRTPIGFNHSDLRQAIASSGGAGAEIGYTQSWGTEEACLASKNSPVVRAFLPAIRAQGGEPTFKVKTGTADMNTFMKAFPGVPMVSYGPGDSTLDHTPEERLPIADLDKAVAVLTDVLVRLDETL